MPRRTRETITILRATMLAMVCACGCALALNRQASATPPTYQDLKYSTNWAQGLDLYLPDDGLGPFPLVIYIHGGGWLQGDKDEVQPYVDPLLSRGFAVASINYRLSYQANYPAQLYDCKGAVRWLRANAQAYDLDPARFATFGESAGANLAALLGTTSGDASQEGSVGGNTGVSSAVQAFIDAFGPTDLFTQAAYSQQGGSEITALIGHDIYDIIDHQGQPNYAGWVALVNSINPATHVRPGDPPAYIFHGLDDDEVAPAESETLASALDDDQVPATLRLAPGVGHTLPNSELPAIWNFLVQQLGAPAPQTLSFGGAHDGDAFGQSVAIIGDVNGDGVDDIVVGAPFNGDRGPNAGRITVNSGANGSVLHIIRGRSAGDRFGWSVAAAGDLDGDGTPDFIVGSPQADANGSNSGRVEVFSGSNWHRLQTFVGEHAGDQLGYAVAAADVDGDGRNDIICGAPTTDIPATNAGCVLVYSGANWTLMRRFRGTAAGDQLGLAVASAGDVNGDGREEIVLGAPHADGNSGYFVVYGFNGSWIKRFEDHGNTGDQLGAAVAGVGDADGDGRADVAVGAPAAMAGDIASGEVKVYSVMDGDLLATLQPSGPQAGEQFGAAVSPAGDVNGDNRADVAVGAFRHDHGGADTGRITVFRGIGGGSLNVQDGPTVGAKFGRSLAGDPGRNWIVVGATGMFWHGARAGVAYVVDPSGP